MTFVQNINISAAFIAGLLSFLSPCVLPLLPAYFSFITGMSLDELTAGEKTAKMKWRVIAAAFTYILGFTLIFVLMGVAASFMGGFITQHKNVLRIAGGVVVIILGLHFLHLINIPLLNHEKRFQIKNARFSGLHTHFIVIFFVGMAFAAGWSPCIGPILGSILILASMEQSGAQGALLLFVYSIGLGLPLLLMAVFISYILPILSRIKKLIRYTNFITGVILIVTGILLVSGKFYWPVA